MAAYTLFDIAYRVARELSVAYEGTATDGNISDTTDSIYLKGRFIDDYFLAGTIYILRDAAGLGAAPQGEWARITRFEASSGKVTHNALTVATAVGDTYALHNSEYTLEMIVQNLNMVLSDMQMPIVDISTITTAEDKTEYTLPAGMLDHTIKVWIQRSTTTDHNLWTEYHDWYIAETAVGTAKKLIFRHQPQEPWVVKIEYWIPHPELHTRTDKLAEYININRVACETALKCLVWKRAQKAMDDPVINGRIQEMTGRVSLLRAKYPVKKPEIKLAAYGLSHNFSYEEEE